MAKRDTAQVAPADPGLLSTEVPEDPGTGAFSREKFVKEFGLFILEKKRLCKDMVSISEQAHRGLEATAQIDLEGRRFLTERKI